MSLIFRNSARFCLGRAQGDSPLALAGEEKRVILVKYVQNLLLLCGKSLPRSLS